MNGVCEMTTTTALVGVVWEVQPQRQWQSEGMMLVERGTPRGLVSHALAARFAVVQTLGAQAPGGDVLQLHQPLALQAWGGRASPVPPHYQIGWVVPTSDN